MRPFGPKFGRREEARRTNRLEIAASWAIVLGLMLLAFLFA